MEPTWIVHAGMAFAVVGFFVAAWFRYRRPVQVRRGGVRVAPEVEAAVPTSRAAPGGAAQTDGRRVPTL